MKTTKGPKTVDEYIANLPVRIQKKVKEIRETIKKVAPQAEEKISYQMPAYALKGILVYFAAHANHIGFYPTSSGVEAFKKELGSFKFAKGSIQFPHDKALPLDLIARIVSFRAKENLKKVAIIPHDVVAHTDLPEMSVDQIPTDGDPLEIKGELYFVCEQELKHQDDHPVIGVIPLVVRDPAKVSNIEKYIECLSIAHRKVQFKNEKGICDLDNCDEMIIS